MTKLVRDDPFYSDLFEIFRGIKKLWTDLAVSHDLSISHIITLRVLACQDSCTMSELTDHLDVTHGAATGTIDRLERDGFVSRSHSPADRRVVQVSLTPAGSALLERLVDSMYLSVDRMVDTLPSQDQSTVHQGVSLLAQVFRTQIAPFPHKARHAHEDKPCS